MTRVACIGAGYWGRNLVRNFHELGALATVCDASPAALNELAQKFPDGRYTSSVRDVLADASVSAVAIATPAETHGHLVRQALEAGKDVFVEKPLCVTLDEGRELVAFAERAGRVLMVGHLLWYHPVVLRLRELVESGELGRIQYIYSTRLNLGRIRREENILWSFAPHDVSVILGLVGEMPDGIQAQGGNYLHPKIADVTVTLLTFPSGVRAHIFVSWLHPYKEQKLVVVGDRKMAVFDDVQPERKLTLYPHAIDWRNHVPVPTRADAQVIPVETGEPLRAECEHFLECVASRRAPRTDGTEGLRVLTVLQQCQTALEGSTPAPRATPGNGDAGYFRHESAFIDDDVTIGSGTTIWHVSHVLRNSRIGRNCRIGQNVVIGPNATIGDGVKIQNNVSVYEGVTLEDHVFCGPSMVFTNVYNPRSEIRRMDELRPTLVRRGATLGANCTIVCGVTIGAYAFVGAGAVVTKDVPDYALIVGNPGRLTGWMCACGERIRFKDSDSMGTCSVCGCTYEKAGTKVWPTA
jgi:UDP-2-acetamido-3-amino-2,3-dideoxy-glucuronate N-acetyltransferase